MSNVHPTALVEDGARLGDGVSIGPYCTVGPHVTLGDGVVLVSHVAVTGHTTIGAGTRIHPFSALGGPPQDLKHEGDSTRLIVGANNLIREHVTMHCGSSGSTGVTTVGNDGFFMVASHVAHDCTLGDGVIMSNNAVMGGHVTIGDHVILGGNSAIHQFVRIGANAMIGGLSGTENDLIPYGMMLGNRDGLSGLNLIGLKRKGFDRAQVKEIRRCYRILFGDEGTGTMDDRTNQVSELYPENAAAMEIVDFIRNRSHRPLSVPRPRRGNPA